MIILTGIRTNEHDWEDMMTEEYLEELKRKDDPEAKLKKEQSLSPISKPNIDNLKKTIETPQPSSTESESKLSGEHDTKSDNESKKII